MQGKKPSTKEVEPVSNPVADAHDQAEKDIEKDPEVNMKPKPLEDLDEGELARAQGHD